MRAPLPLALVCLVGCGGLRTTTEPTVEAGVLRATVGREGGQFGSEASPFLGLNVDVPPNATPFPFAVEVRAYLPIAVELEGRVAVGPAFALDAGGLVLGQAMRVRLPIDVDLLRWAGAGPEALRVLVGEPGGWTEVDGAITAAGDAVEIEVDRFVRLVPTVRVEQRDPCAVGEGCVRASPLVGASCAADFCVERLPRAELAPDGRPGQALVVDGDALVHSARSTDGWVLVRREPDAAEASVLARLEPTVPQLYGLALDRTREAWLGLGRGGNLQVAAGRPPLPLDPEVDGHGAVALSDGSVVLLRSDGIRRRAVGELGLGPVVTPPLPPDRGGRLDALGARPLRAEPGLLLATAPVQLEFVVLGAGGLAADIRRERRLPAELPIGRHAPLALAADDQTLVYRALSVEGPLVVSRAAGAPEIVDGLERASALVFDAWGRLWIGFVDRSELAVMSELGPAGPPTITRVRIGDDSATPSPTRALAVLPDGRVLVVTESGELIRVSERP